MAEKVSPKKKGRKPILDPELVAAAIAELDGNLASVAKRFNVDRAAVAHLIDKRPSLQQVLSDAREGMLDAAESSLYKAVKDGEAWAVCFFLKTQGKTRGYTEKVADADENKKPDTGLDLLARLVARHVASQSDGSGASGTVPGGPVSPPVGPEPGPPSSSVPE